MGQLKIKGRFVKKRTVEVPDLNKVKKKCMVILKKKGKTDVEVYRVYKLKGYRRARGPRAKHEHDYICYYRKILYKHKKSRKR